jgi:transmembrane sensor
MERKDQYLKIARIIAGELNGTATKEDLEFLESWLNESDWNREIYGEIKEKSWYADHIKAIKKYNPDEGWNKVKGRITISSKIRLLFLPAAKYAAAVIILLSVAFFARNYLTDQEPAFVQIPIEPGVKGARLVMDDGRIIPLTSDTIFSITEKDGTIIDKKSGVINYENNNTVSHDEVFNTLITNTGQEFALMLSDGTKVRLNAESRIRFPVAFVKSERIVEVTGEAYFEVAHDDKHPFIVKTQQSSIRVLGTAFNVRAYEDDPAEATTLVRGSVSIRRGDDTDVAVRLKPGDQATITPSAGEIKVEQVDTTYYTTWKDGKFIFRNERLEDIVRNLRRWYHFEVEYKEDQVKDIRFGARIDRYAEVNTIFNIMNNTRLVHIVQDSTKVIVNTFVNEAKKNAEDN